MTLFDAEAAPVEAPVRSRLRMTVAYDGTDFRGFAAQGGDVRTVAGALGGAVERVLGHPVRFVVAGRTDAGVHAWGNVVHFDSPRAADEIDLAALRRSVTKLLAPAVVIRAVEVAPEGFDARHSAVGRCYRYTVLNREVPDPFVHRTTWQVEAPLDLRAMQAACDPLLGEHDFSSFCRKPPDPSGSNVRRVHDARWLDLGDGLLRFDIEASSFCQQMVRSVVGTLAEVGLGRRRAGDMAWTIRCRDRSGAGQLAPARGLCLWEVRYP
ncbi:MAG TPA: tRNA pseudouridine(38-40) synthase TruA [Acidimicrobiales bacterium]|nr:tRNA pseudouridine(38-40) synthase TruA [Acidimicrobiales bacterium]